MDTAWGSDLTKPKFSIEKHANFGWMEYGKSSVLSVALLFSILLGVLRFGPADYLFFMLCIWAMIRGSPGLRDQGL